MLYTIEIKVRVDAESDEEARDEVADTLIADGYKPEITVSYEGV